MLVVRCVGEKSFAIVVGVWCFFFFNFRSVCHFFVLISGGRY